MERGRDEALSLYQLKKKHVLDNPYPFYLTLQEEDPIHYDPFTKAWLCSRYDHVVALLHDPRLSANRLRSLDELAARGMEKMCPIYHTLSQQMPRSPRS
jgi:cytochrome P450